MKKLCLKPLDILIFSALIGTGVFLTVKSLKPSGNTVIVQAAQNTYQYALSKEGIYTVEGAIGPTTFEIKQDKVHILDSACPGKNCVHQGFSNPLVCLPNQVIITIEKYGDFDAISE